MTFGKVRRSTKFQTTNAKNTIEKYPKIDGKSDPEALQNSSQKNNSKKTPKNRKKSRKSTPRWGPKSEPRMWFSDMEGPLSAPGRQNGPQTSSPEPPRPSEPRFLMILGTLFQEFRIIFNGSGSHLGSNPV